MLNARRLYEKAIITNVPDFCIAQHGIDLQLIKVNRLLDVGVIPSDADKSDLMTMKQKSKTVLPQYIPVELDEQDCWNLEVGYYEITFAQGCKIPADSMLLIRQRSSLLRCGGILHSSVFDAGFETNNIGTCMTILHPITIQYGARIAQIYEHKVLEEIDQKDLYGAEGKGSQFQNDNQRK